MNKIRHTAHARYELWYYVAWSTKYRKHIFKNPRTKEEVKTIFRTTASHYDMEIAEVNVLSDHVHLSISAPPRIAPAKAVQILKSVSTKLLFQKYKWLKNEYWGGEVWVAGYFVRSVGKGVTKEMIDKYVREQSEET
jgi:putative transposase